MCSPPPEVDQTKVALYVVSFAVVVQGDAKRIMRTLHRRPSQPWVLLPHSYGRAGSQAALAAVG